MDYEIKIYNIYKPKVISKQSELDSISPTMTYIPDDCIEDYISDVSRSDNGFISIPLYVRNQYANIPPNSVLTLYTSNSDEVIYFSSLIVDNCKITVEESGGGGGTPIETVTYEGEPPLVFESNGEPASAYSFTGNLVQSSEPSKVSPSYPSEVGSLVTSGEHLGQYEIVMSVGGTTQTIYLNEPLRKFEDSIDTLDSDGTVIRKIAKIEFTGTENWGYTVDMHKLPFDGTGSPAYLRETKLIAVCSHYTAIANQAQANLQDNQLTFLVSASGTNNLYIKDTSCADTVAFKAYLAEQYSAGTPVTIWYLTAQDRVESITCPELTLTKGSNTLSFNTDAQPTDCSLTCTIGGGGGGGSSSSADRIAYSNIKSGLSSANVQGAIDELASIQKNSNKSLYGVGFQRTTGSLSNGNSLILDGTNVKKDNTFSFMAKITSFNTILVGQGLNVYSGAWAEINDTNLIVHNYAQDDTTVEYAHGLTISDYIYVQIFVSIAKADIVITSGGNTFKQANVNWYACNGDYFARSSGSSLTECVLTWSSKDFRKSVWVFGDSYIGLNNPARWATQLRNAGFADNVLFNGYAGEASGAALTSLTNCLENYGQPQKLVWCLGMNDGADSGNTPSSNWSNGIAQVEKLCSSYGIELIYATIPSVPNQNNEAKNNYIRNKGKRYIDFAKAVGASSNGTWYSGMLSNDNVHPSESGAIALYNRAIADCPELMYPNP